MRKPTEGEGQEPAESKSLENTWVCGKDSEME